MSSTRPLRVLAIAAAVLCMCASVDAGARDTVLGHDSSAAGYAIGTKPEAPARHQRLAATWADITATTPSTATTTVSASTIRPATTKPTTTSTTTMGPTSTVPTTVPAMVPTTVPTTAAAAAAANADPGLVGIERAKAAFASGITAQWRAALPVQIHWISGSTSYMDTYGNAYISEYHLSRSWERLRWVVAHEWGHHVALERGSGRAFGAAPTGFPGSDDPELWANCVADVFIGRMTTPRSPVCTSQQLSWTSDWFAHGP